MNYLFKDGNGFVFGNTPQSECPSGLYRIEPNADLSAVSIRYANDDRIKMPEAPIASFVDAAGTPYANYAALKAAAEGFFDLQDDGVCNGEEDAVLSDTVDLAHPGYFQPTLIDGTVKYMTVRGNIRTRTITKDTCSLVRVKRIYLNGTTAAMGIVIYY